MRVVWRLPFANKNVRVPNASRALHGCHQEANVYQAGGHLLEPGKSLPKAKLDRLSCFLALLALIFLGGTFGLTQAGALGIRSQVTLRHIGGSEMSCVRSFSTVEEEPTLKTLHVDSASMPGEALALVPSSIGAHTLALNISENFGGSRSPSRNP